MEVLQEATEAERRNAPRRPADPEVHAEDKKEVSTSLMEQGKAVGRASALLLCSTISPVQEQGGFALQYICGILLSERTERLRHALFRGCYGKVLLEV